MILLDPLALPALVETLLRRALVEEIGRGREVKRMFFLSVALLR